MLYFQIETVDYFSLDYLAKTTLKLAGFSVRDNNMLTSRLFSNGNTRVCWVSWLVRANSKR